SSGTSARSARSPLVVTAAKRSILRIWAGSSRVAKRPSRGAPQAVEAHVVGSSLEQRDGRPRGERRAHRRQVPIEELVLQRLGSGGNDDLAAGEKRRHQVGEGLAG